VPHTSTVETKDKGNKEPTFNLQTKYVYNFYNSSNSINLSNSSNSTKIENSKSVEEASSRVKKNYIFLFFLK